jgi:hypothetical protein
MLYIYVYCLLENLRFQAVNSTSDTYFLLQPCDGYLDSRNV